MTEGQKALDKLGTKTIALNWKHIEFADAYHIVRRMRAWVKEHELSELSFYWSNTGDYLPSHIMLDNEDALAFMFTFGDICGK